jgi:hypothetical protein
VTSFFSRRNFVFHLSGIDQAPFLVVSARFDSARGARLGRGRGRRPGRGTGRRQRALRLGRGLLVGAAIRALALLVARRVALLVRPRGRAVEHLVLAAGGAGHGDVAVLVRGDAHALAVLHEERAAVAVMLVHRHVS